MEKIKITKQRNQKSKNKNVTIHADKTRPCFLQRFIHSAMNTLLLLCTHRMYWIACII